MTQKESLLVAMRRAAEENEKAWDKFREWMKNEQDDDDVETAADEMVAYTDKIAQFYGWVR